MARDVPEIRYVRRDGSNIAYQRWGTGDKVQVFVPPLVSNLEVAWELPEYAELFRRAAKVLDLITFDKRGTGLSDHGDGPADFETHAADLIAIMDNEQVQTAGLVGFSEGGILPLVAAALNPDRVTSVVTQGTPVMGADMEDLEARADPVNPVPTAKEQADRYRAMLRGWATADSA